MEGECYMETEDPTVVERCRERWEDRRESYRMVLSV